MEIDKDLISYQEAHSSAQHYNNMIWTLASIGWAFSFLIFKMVFFDITIIEINGLSSITSKLILLFFGLCALGYFILIIERANSNKEIRYLISKKIEQEKKLIPQELIEPTGIKGTTIFGLLNGGILLVYISSFIYFGFLAESKEINFVISIISIEIALFIVGHEVYCYTKNKLNLKLLKNKKLEELRKLQF